MKTSRWFRAGALVLASAMAFLGGGTSSVLALCGPFTDVTGPFCPFILQIFYQGITSGTSATTYSPGDPVTRGQMAVFLARTMNLSLAKAGRRAALDQWWTPQPAPAGLGLTGVGSSPALPKSDGTDVWVPKLTGTVSRVRASDGRVLGDWTNAGVAYAALVAMGRVFVTGRTTPSGALYMIDPGFLPGPVTVVASNLPSEPRGIAFDGAKIWTANNNSVSIITPGTWSVATVTTGFVEPRGVVFDGSNVWVTDIGDDTLKKLDAGGGVLQSVAVGADPWFPVFDGTNIWVPNEVSHTVTVVRASTGAVLETLSGNGLNFPFAAAFDGQRILVTNMAEGVSLFRAADLSPIGSFATPAGSIPWGVCSDGVSLWISFNQSGMLARL